MIQIPQQQYFHKTDLSLSDMNIYESVGLILGTVFGSLLKLLF